MIKNLRRKLNNNQHLIMLIDKRNWHQWQLYLNELIGQSKFDAGYRFDYYQCKIIYHHWQHYQWIPFYRVMYLNILPYNSLLFFNRWYHKSIENRIISATVLLCYDGVTWNSKNRHVCRLSGDTEPWRHARSLTHSYGCQGDAD